MPIAVTKCSSFSEVFKVLSSELSECNLVGVLIYGEVIANLGPKSIILRKNLLLRLLTNLTGTSEDGLKLSFLPNRKPICPFLFFNHSNTDGGWFYGFSRWSEIGVDVEKKGKKFDINEIVDLFFPSDEQKNYYATLPSKREDYFLKLWTIKEATAKCFGIPLDQALKKSIQHNNYSCCLENYQIAIAYLRNLSEVKVATYCPVEHALIQEEFGI
jgi:phosphopantetheinyl transferase